MKRSRCLALPAMRQPADSEEQFKSSPFHLQALEFPRSLTTAFAMDSCFGSVGLFCTASSDASGHAPLFLVLSSPMRTLIR